MEAMIKTFEEMKKNMESGVFDKTDNGTCTQCGACCSNILPMTDDEVRTIKRYVKKNRIKEFKHATNVMSNPTLDLTCPFLNDDKQEEKCMIYEVRPRVCREFICCPSKRKPLDIDYARKAQLRNVREVFFGENYLSKSQHQLSIR